MRKRLVLFLLFASVAAAGVRAADSTAAPTWKIDHAHSKIGFRVTHLMISRVEGRFGDYDAVIDFRPEDLEISSVKVTITASSINTENENRDNDLRSPHFFDVEKYPKITFVSKKVTRTGDKTFTLAGDLTIRDSTKEITLQGTLNGPIDVPWGGQRAGISLLGTINRQDFGVSWNKTLDNGGLVVSDEVTLDIELELARPAES